MTKKKEVVSDEILEGVLKDIEHQFGRGSIMKLGDVPNSDVDVISSGSILLDRCLGVGGYPKGRIVEIYGPESSGKTTLALTAIAQTQAGGGKAAFIDAENSIDPEYAETLGVKIQDLVLSQPDSGEQALEIVEVLIKSGVFDLIVVDSVAALTPQAELEGLMSDANIGLQARMMSKAMRKIAGLLNRNGVTIIFINQLREKVGVIYGNPETTSGGRALKFYASIRIDIRRGEAIKEGSKLVGNVAKIRVVKNKVSPPFAGCEVDIIYGRGISKLGEIVDLAADREIIKKSGSWYEVNGEKMGQGREAAQNFLLERPELLKSIEDKLRHKN